MASRAFDMQASADIGNSRLELLRSAPMNSWLALSSDETRIIAIGKTFTEADAIAKKSGEQNYVLTRTPDVWLSRAFPAAR